MVAKERTGIGSRRAVRRACACLFAVLISVPLAFEGHRQGGPSASLAQASSTSITPSAMADIPNGTDANGSSLTLAPASSANSIAVGSTPVSPAWSPDGTQLAVANSGANTVSIISYAAHAVSATVTLPSSSPNTLSWSPDGTQLAVAMGSTAPYFLSFIDATTHSVTSGLYVGASVTSAVWSPDSTQIAVSDGANGTIRFVSATTHLVTDTVTDGGNIDRLAWNPSGTELAVAGGNLPFSGYLSIRNGSTHASDGTTSLGAEIPVDISWSADGSQIAMTAGLMGDNSNGVIIFLDGQTYAINTTVSFSGSKYGPIAWSPDSSQVAASSYYGNNMVFVDGATYTPSSTVAVTAATAPVWSLDSSQVAVGSATGAGVAFVSGSTHALLTTVTVPSANSSFSWRPGGSSVMASANYGSSSASFVSGTSHTILSWGSGYPQYGTGTGTTSVTPSGGALNHWTGATVGTTVPSGTGVIPYYSVTGANAGEDCVALASDPDWTTDITTLPPSATLYADACLSSPSDPAVTPSLDSLVISYTLLSVSALSPSGGQTYLIGAGTGAVSAVPLSWSVSDTYGTDHIKTSYSTDSGASWTVVSASLASSAISDSWTPSALSTAHARVKVEYLDGSNAVLASATSASDFTVVTNVAPTAAATSPLDGASLATGTLAFSAGMDDADSGDTVTGDWRLCADSGCSTVVDSVSGQAVTLVAGSGTFSLNRSVSVGDYYWEVRSHDSYGATSGWSAARSLGVVPGNATPTVGSLGPSNLVDGSRVSAVHPTLTFLTADANSGDTVRYRVQVSTHADLSSLVIDYSSALSSPGTSSFTVGQAAGAGSYATGSSGQSLAENGYYWRVLVTDNNSASSAWVTANGGAVAFVVDTTAPVVLSVALRSDNQGVTSLATIGNTVTVTFDASEPLLANPTVTLGGKTVQFVSLAGSTYVYSRVIDGTEAQGTGSPVVISVTDRAGNGGSGSGSFSLDFTAPTFSGIATTSNDATSSGIGKLGDTVTTAFAASETLRSDPIVYLGGRPMSLVAKDGLAYAFSRVLDGSETAGTGIQIAGTDLVANVGTGSGAFLIDFSAPKTPSPAVATPAPAATRPSATPTPSLTPTPTAEVSPSPSAAVSPSPTPSSSPASLIANVTVTSTGDGNVISFTPPAAPSGESAPVTVAVYRSISPDEPGVLVGTTTTGSFTDTGASQGVTYYYTLYALDPAAPVPSVATTAPPVAPLASVRVQAKAVSAVSPVVAIASAVLTAATGLTVAGAGAAAALSGLVAQTGDIVLSLQLFLTGLRPRRRTSWGVAREKEGGLPIIGADIVLLDVHRKEIDRVASDRFGEFSLLAPAAGEYAVAVRSAGYAHATPLTIMIADPTQAPSGLVVTAQPTAKLRSDRQRLAARMARAILFLDMLRWPFLVAGTAVSAYVSFVAPDLLSLLEATLYALIWLSYLLLLLRTVRAFGTVADGQTQAPLFHAAVIFFAQDNGGTRLTPSRAVSTDQKGRYWARLDKGRYVLRAEHAGYLMGTEGPLEMVSSAPVASDIALISAGAFEESLPEEPSPPTKTGPSVIPTNL